MQPRRSTDQAGEAVLGAADSRRLEADDCHDALDQKVLPAVTRCGIFIGKAWDVSSSKSWVRQ